jgi:hypothetical protein
MYEMRVPGMIATAVASDVDFSAGSGIAPEVRQGTVRSGRLIAAVEIPENRAGYVPVWLFWEDLDEA